MIDWESCVCEMTVWRSRNWGDDFSVRRICVHGASLWTVAVADLRYSALWELLTLVPRIDWFVSAGFLLGVLALLLWHRYMAAEERRFHDVWSMWWCGERLDTPGIFALSSLCGCRGEEMVWRYICLIPEHVVMWNAGRTHQESMSTRDAIEWTFVLAVVNVNIEHCVNWLDQGK